MNDLQLIDIADNLIILNRITIEKLYHLDKAGDCVALYVLYYRLAKWQKTNKIKALDSYVCKALGWGKDKITKIKKILKEQGLIELIQNRKNGKIDGWLIKVNYIISEKKVDGLEFVVNNLPVTENPVTDFTSSCSQDTIALRNNINCLKNKIELLKEENNKLKSLLKEKSKSPSSKTIKPTVEEIKKYCQERNNSIDAERFYDYYESNGWKVGRNPMKDWKATIRTWEKNDKQHEDNITTYQERMISQQDKAREEFLNGG